MITQLNCTGIEIQLRGENGLLPSLQRGHRVVAEFVREAANGVGGEVECEGGVVVIEIFFGFCS